MAVTIIFYSNLPLGIIMYHLQVEIIAVPNYPRWGNLGQNHFDKNDKIVPNYPQFTLEYFRPEWVYYCYSSESHAPLSM